MSDAFMFDPPVPPPSSCANATCVQYRIQHRNMTMKKLELEKELEQLKRAQDAHFNNAVSRNAVTQFRDAATGEMGMMMPNGEVMTKEKIMKKMEIAAKCMETSCAYEKQNRGVTEENKKLKEDNTRLFNEGKRLHNILIGFEKPRRYDTFTDEQHERTLIMNEELANEVEALENETHRLQEENALLVRRHKRLKDENTQLKSKKPDEPEQQPSSPRIAKKKKRDMRLDSDDEASWDQISATPQRALSPDAENVIDFSDEERT